MLFYDFRNLEAFYFLCYTQITKYFAVLFKEAFEKNHYLKPDQSNTNKNALKNKNAMTTFITISFNYYFV